MWLCLLLAGFFAYLAATDPFDPAYKFSWRQPYLNLGFLCVLGACFFAVFAWIFSKGPKQDWVGTNECPVPEEKP
jgi:hypothetical protein